GSPSGAMPQMGMPKPDPWKSFPPPPGAGASPSAPSPGEPPSDAVLPRRTIDITDMAKVLAQKGIKGQDAFDVMDAWKPFMDSQNKSALAEMTQEYRIKEATARYERELRLSAQSSGDKPIKPTA